MPDGQRPEERRLTDTRSWEDARGELLYRLGAAERLSEANTAAIAQISADVIRLIERVQVAHEAERESSTLRPQYWMLFVAALNVGTIVGLKVIG